MLRQALLTVEMLKTYTSNVRRAWYPDVSQFEQDREKSKPRGQHIRRNVH